MNEFLYYYAPYITLALAMLLSWVVATKSVKYEDES